MSVEEAAEAFEKTPSSENEEKAEEASEGVGPQDFNLENLQRFFDEAVIPEEEGSVSIPKYLLGYEELFKFLNLLGTVFGWVASDVKTKMDIVRGHLENKEVKDKYQALGTMLEYEVTAKMIKHKAKDSTTGSRNILRLHRALEYIIAFLDAVQPLEITEKCCGISQDAYKRTLLKFHPWVVQKAALLAMHMLPTKEGLLIKICGKSGEEELKWATELLQKAVSAMKIVYDKTQELYDKHELLNLP